VAPRRRRMTIESMLNSRTNGQRKDKERILPCHARASLDLKSVGQG
jgi:hypothetical protein